MSGRNAGGRPKKGPPPEPPRSGGAGGSGANPQASHGASARPDATRAPAANSAGPGGAATAVASGTSPGGATTRSRTYDATMPAPKVATPTSAAGRRLGLSPVDEEDHDIEQQQLDPQTDLQAILNLATPKSSATDSSFKTPNTSTPMATMTPGVQTGGSQPSTVRVGANANRPDVRIDIPDVDETSPKDVFGPLNSLVQHVLTPPAGKTSVLGSPQHRIEEEGLGESWHLKPWKAPSVQQAEEERGKAMFHQGRAPFYETGPEEMLPMGVGVSLYFYFVRSLALFFAVAALLHVPHIILCYYGGMLAAYKIGTTQMGSFTAANHLIKYPGSNTTVWCEGEWADTLFADRVPCSEPLIRLFADIQPAGAAPIYIRAIHASYVVTYCDLVTCLVFLLFWQALVRKTRDMVARGPMAAVSAKDYAVVVRGLPKDATEREIAQHFSKLYAINGVFDWTYFGDCCGLIGAKRTQRVAIRIVDLTGKVIGPDLQPVERPLPFHHSSIYRDSWIAEVAVARPNGSLIRRFKALEQLTEQLLYERAVAKKYNDNTTYKGGEGADKIKFKRAKQRLARTMEQIQNVKNKLKALGPELTRIESECVAAYVIFEHRKSWERCIKDYRHHSNRLVLRRPPEALRFRGEHRLIVTEAPEPSNVLWENLEVSKSHRFARRALVMLGTLWLLGLTLLTVIYLQWFSQSYVPTIQGDVCDSLFVLQNAGPRSNFVYYDQGNAYCNDTQAYYVSYLPPTAVSQSDPCSNPCVNPQDAARFTASYTCADDVTYRASDVVTCFCLNTIGRSLSTLGPLGAYRAVKANYYQLCQGPTYNYVVSQILGTAVSMVTVVVNEAISMSLAALTDFERHHSVSAAALTSFLKSFAALFVNTVVILFLVNGYVRNKLMNRLGLFQGRSVDFDLSWYMSVGIALSNTMLINCVSTHLPRLVTQVLYRPAYRLFNTGYGSVSQYHLNKLYRPEPFLIQSRLSVLMNTLAVSLFFSAGLPLLMPFAALALALTYCIDKLLVLRYCARPPAYDATLITFAVHSMPYLLVIHLLLSIWTYGNPDIFASEAWEGSINGVHFGSYTAGSVKNPYSRIKTATQSYDRVGAVPRLFRYNTLPLVALLFVLVLLKVFTRIGLEVVGGFFLWLIELLLKPCHCALQCLLGRNKNKAIPDKVCNFSPYTRPFEVMYPSASHVPVLPPDSGWATEPVEVPDYPESLVVKLVKYWTKDCVVDGVRASAGERKKTWEVIRDSTLHTYRIEENPQYSDAMLVKTTLKIHAGASFLVRNPAQQGTIVQVMPTGS